MMHIARTKLSRGGNNNKQSNKYQYRSFHASSPFFNNDRRNSPREVDEPDVLIVGGGPSGLAAAIRLKQLADERNQEIRIALLEKGSEVGAHILSGAVMDPKALNELIPDWKSKGAPLNTEVTKDRLLFLTQQSKIQIPTLFPALQNHGNYIVSLSNVCKWLGQQAEDMGIEVYAGFAGSEVLYNEDGSVKGVATGDVGIAKDGSIKANFERGIEMHPKITLFAEGCRGSLTKQLTSKFNLRANSSHPTYGIGIKELWRVKDDKYEKGLVQHTLGWPMDSRTYGGSFLYHMEDNLVSVGYVVALDYENPYLNPYKEFQRWKEHPVIRTTFEDGECIGYGARAISEGGLQSIPKLVFPGGALIGDCAGFLNVPRIKGSHTAMKSGMLCAEATFDALFPNDKKNEDGKPIVLDTYEQKFKNSWLYDELKGVRNFRPSFKYGLIPGMVIGAIDTFLFNGKLPFTLSHHSKPDHETLKPKDQATPIEYPKPDGKLTFELLTNLRRSNTFHEENQPCHLTLKDKEYQTEVSYKEYDGPENKFCPAGVYEYLPNQDGSVRFHINQSNCIHCKTCDIKVDNITWVPPEGGGGPKYSNM